MAIQAAIKFGRGREGFYRDARIIITKSEFTLEEVEEAIKELTNARDRLRGASAADKAEPGVGQEGGSRK